jgi:hypothetical protein
LKRAVLVLVACACACAAAACTNAYDDFKFPKTPTAEGDDTESTPAVIASDGGADAAPEAGKSR